MTIRRVCLSLILASISVLGTTGALAITDEELFSRLQLNFFPPGARAAGLGGAFIALADDATASVANPAGLTILTRREFAFEYKTLEYPTQRVFGSQDNSLGFPDQTTPINFRQFKDDVGTLPYASFTYPFSKATASFYRQQLMDFEQSFFTEGAFVPGSFDVDQSGVFDPDEVFRFLPVQGGLGSEIVAWGGALGFKFNERFSAGLSIRYTDLSWDSSMQRFAIDNATCEPGSTEPGCFHGPADRSPGNVEYDYQVHGDDSAVSYTAGLLWKAGNRVTLGTVYRGDSEFDTTHVFTTGPADPNPGVTTTETFKVVVPETLGAGIAVRPTEKWLISADVLRIAYSDICRGFVTLSSSLKPQDYTVDDATELHLGLEYVVLAKQLPIALRAGYYLDPDHSIRYVGTGEWADPTWSLNPEEARLNTEVEQLRFPGGEDLDHFTFGLGFVAGKVQLDIAGDFSDRGDSLLSSVVFRF